METVRQQTPLLDADIRLPGFVGESSSLLVPSDLESGSLPPAYHEQVRRTVMPRPRSADELDRGVPEDVFGGESRLRVWNPRAYPFSAICALHFSAPNGDTYAGSGVLIGPRLVLTAGHNLFKHKYRPTYDGYMKTVRVYPGLNGDVNSPPFGSSAHADLWTLTTWTEDADPQFDIGAVLLPTPLGKQAGWLSVARFTEGTLSGLAVSCASFPRDCPRPNQPGACGPEATTMWMDSGNIQLVEPNRIRYQLDTTEGSSGAPVFAFFPDKADPYQVVAVHNYAHTSYNAGTRINDAIFPIIVDWLEMADAAP
jgi:glutamyl endopeptidase